MKKRILALALCFTVGGFMLSGCGQEKKEAVVSPEKKTVYTSFYPMYDFTKKVAGDKLNVVNIVPVGQEPHEYELSTEDRKNLEHADALVYNGAGMEEWVDDLKDAMKDKPLKFIAASDGLELREGHAHHHHHHGEDAEHEHDGEHKKDAEHEHDGEHKADAEHEHDGEHKADAEHEHDGEHKEDADCCEEEEHHEHGGHDPHVWLSPVNAKKEMENIKNALAELDPENKAYYEDNYKKYAKEMDDLDAAYKEKLAPHKGKHIVVSHEAFGYLCDRYGIKQVGIEGLSPESEPSPAKMAEIIDFVKKEKISTVFYEEMVSPKVAEAIASETKAKAEVLSPLEGLSQEDLDAGEDYISVMKKNLERLDAALSAE